MMVFVDRADAGRRLGEALAHLHDQPVVVLGLPRGGVPVASAVAAALTAPLDVIVVRKLGVPYQPELGMGAIGEDGVRVVNDAVMRAAAVTDEELARVEAAERVALEHRAARLRGRRAPVPLTGRTAVIVDDGIATGSTARAACAVARARGASRIVLAVPVAPPGWQEHIGAIADECVALMTPVPFYAIGDFYEDFSQTTDDEVVRCLEQAAARARAPGGPDAADRVAHDAEVVVAAGATPLGGHLSVPAGAAGIVVFAHGSGSSRLSPRNRAVAAALNRAGLGTLLFDLLSVDEADERGNVFDISLLASRLLDATAWVRSRPECAGLPLGYFGASTGAGAALVAAAAPEADVAAVVSRGGRPDLADAALPAVRAPTLLIVGGNDPVVLELNRQARARLRCESRLVVVPGATHLFSEPGALEAVADHAAAWFCRHLASPLLPG